MWTIENEAVKIENIVSASVNDPIVQLIVMDYNKDGSVYGSQFSANVMKVIHMIHDTKPSMFYLRWLHASGSSYTSQDYMATDNQNLNSISNAINVCIAHSRELEVDYWIKVC